MKKIIIGLLFLCLACNNHQPIVIIDKRNIVKAKILGGEIYFTTRYIAHDGKRVYKIEQLNAYQEWEIGDTIGYGGKIFINKKRDKGYE